MIFLYHKSDEYFNMLIGQNLIGRILENVIKVDKKVFV